MKLEKKILGKVKWKISFVFWKENDKHFHFLSFRASVGLYIGLNYSRTMENRITDTSSSFSTKQKSSKENSKEDPNDSKEEKKRNLDQSATESTKPQKKARI